MRRFERIRRLWVPAALEGAKEAVYQQTDIGCAAADAVRAASGANLAIVNGGDIANYLPGGNVSTEDVENVFSVDREIAVAEISPARLKEILEISVEHAVIGENFYIDNTASAFEGFAQISGFTFTFDVSAPAGERVTKAALADGTALNLTDEETSLTLAASTYMLSGGYDYPQLEHSLTGLMFSEALEASVAAGTALAPEGERISVIGSNDNSIVSNFSPLTIVVAVSVIAIAVIFGTRKYYNSK